MAGADRGHRPACRNASPPVHGELAGLTEPVTISAGIAFFPEHADDLHSLQKRADMALYRSKFNGRAQVSIYGADEPDGPGRSLRGSLRLPSEPEPSVSRLPTAGCSPCIALSRWSMRSADAAARERGLLSPAKFSAVLDRWRVFNSNHSRSVATLAVALARRLGVDGDELDNVHIAALLHDVGKIALPENVLSKPGPLTDDERELVQRHSIIGYELLCDLGIPQAAEFVLHHHERWDGGGYPGGKAGAEIPFGSRLILVADAFDALTSDRSYRRGVSVEAAIQEIQRESGRQFDPADRLGAARALRASGGVAPAGAGCTSRPGGARNGLRRRRPSRARRRQAARRPSGRAGGRGDPGRPVSPSRRSHCRWPPFRRASCRGRRRPWRAGSGSSRMHSCRDADSERPTARDADHRCGADEQSRRHPGERRTDARSPIRAGGGGRPYSSHNNSIEVVRPHLAPLVDRWAVPHWIPLGNVFSVGDVLIAIGIAVAVVVAMRGTADRLSRRSFASSRSPADRAIVCDAFRGHCGVRR